MGIVQISGATTYTFQPGTNDMNDLDHNYYYSWKINWNIPSGEIITGATLTFKNIWDWQNEPRDTLYVHLLDNPPALKTRLADNLWSGTDNEGGGDYWNGKGPLIGTWNDPKGGNNGKDKLPYLTFSVPQADPLYADLGDLTNFIVNDGKFGFGLDPDCHYYNDGIKFTITTETEPVPTPEPSTIFLLAGGLAGLAFLIKKFKK
jgi:hypothetical protein